MRRFRNSAHVVALNPNDLRGQIREMVAAGKYNQPSPRQIARQRLILGLTTSRCCHDKELLVTSRDGGFITRDCLNCGARANYVNLSQIPDLDCDGCLRFKRSNTVEPLLKERNYWYG